MTYQGSNDSLLSMDVKEYEGYVNRKITFYEKELFDRSCQVWALLWFITGSILAFITFQNPFWFIFAVVCSLYMASLIRYIQSVQDLLVRYHDEFW